MQIDVASRSHGHEYLVLLPSPSWTRCLTALLSLLVVEARFQPRFVGREITIVVNKDDAAFTFDA